MPNPASGYCRTWFRRRHVLHVRLRKVNLSPQSSQRRIEKLDLRSIQFNHQEDDRQTQTDPVSPALAETIESLERALPILRMNAGAGVVYIENDILNQDNPESSPRGRP